MFRRILVSLVLPLLLLAGPVGAGGRDHQATPRVPGAAPSLQVAVVAQGLTIPWDVVFTPTGSMIWTERPGNFGIRLPDGETRSLRADLRDLQASGESGLMGLEIDPDFGANRRLYTCQAHKGGSVHVVVWRLDRAGTGLTRVIDPLVVIDSGSRHAGCRVRFGPEGGLWIATGDAAVGSNPQNLTTLAGKVLRVDPRTGEGWPTNRFRRSRNADTRRVFSYGHRNIQGLVRRPCTDAMWSVEHGPDRDDEINRLVNGGNYGWDPVPGYNEAVPMTDRRKYPDAVVAAWSSGSPTLATSGATWLQGAQWGELDGSLAVATLKDQSLRFFDFDRDDRLLGTPVTALEGTWGRLRTPVLGPDGTLYVTTSNGGGIDVILRVTPAGARGDGRSVDGDEYGDLAVSVPGDKAVQIFSGGAGGAGSGGETLVHATDLGADGPPFGFAGSLAIGDLNGDGSADLASYARDDGGTVYVSCGQTGGLDAAATQAVSQRGPFIGVPSADDFGSATAFGDFDGDGYDDLAIGAPRERVAGHAEAGAVTVVPGSDSGLRAGEALVLTQRRDAEAHDRFGAALAVGDFDGDGFDDLAVGAASEQIGSLERAGAVFVFRGTALGIDRLAVAAFGQRRGIEAGDRFGAALAAGDLDGDGRDELVVSAPNETLGARTGAVGRAGAISVVPGTRSGPDPSAMDHLTLRRAGGPIPRFNDRFGTAVVVADLDGDGQAEIVVGAPNQGRGRGLVVVVSDTVPQRLTQPGRREWMDRFGLSLAVGDWNGDERPDLAVGAPFEGVTASRLNGHGIVSVFAGTGGGFVPEANLHQGRGSLGTPQDADRFGLDLAGS